MGIPFILCPHFHLTQWDSHKVKGISINIRHRMLA